MILNSSAKLQLFGFTYKYSMHSLLSITGENIKLYQACAKSLHSSFIQFILP